MLGHLWKLLKALSASETVSRMGGYQGYSEVKQEIIGWQRRLAMCCLWISSGGRKAWGAAGQLDSALTQVAQMTREIPAATGPEEVRRHTEHLELSRTLLVKSAFANLDNGGLTELLPAFFQLAETACLLPTATPTETRLLSGLKGELWGALALALGSKRLASEENRQATLGQLAELLEEGSLPALLCALKLLQTGPEADH